MSAPTRAAVVTAIKAAVVTEIEFHKKVIVARMDRRTLPIAELDAGIDACDQAYANLDEALADFERGIRESNE